ncbi:unnamed protein product [Acanthoscelides obtectus]|uniref:Glycosyl hydrolase family 13 catalytic domain-containing protein n=1 Tax=Acanthoscelides obtectus TaxID=200917 RepID=A0A9P0LNU6_ACAOB|nr:unnamed protein product [Acanthoscelides obtectus]CAK1641609.1 Maltase 2 [Acanthoscelides obtectus]
MKGATWLIVSLALCWDSAWGNVVKVNLDDTLKYNHVGVEGDDTPKPDEDDWWKNAVFYQIYPRSFRDNDRDGDGDLKGVIEKLPYLKELGITGAWLSPIFKSPEADQGYDVSDYRSINERFGTMADLTELVKEAHKLGLKIILDFVPNHTSDQHDWFQKSVAGTDRYKDYYVWKDGKYNKTNGVRLPPNNWVSS